MSEIIYPLESPYLLFVADARERTFAKTALGVLHWRPEKCLGQYRFTQDALDLGLPDMTMQEAAEAGVKTIVVGVAPDGGRLGPDWIAPLEDGLRRGMSIASGLHSRLLNIDTLTRAAGESGAAIRDVRHYDLPLPVATGLKRTGQRLLTVGTDCAVGKMYTALSIEAELLRRGRAADFRATGQTGIFITGDGISVDAVVSDFVSGAAELLSPDNDADHWDVIEGQGSLFHPSYAGVSLGLLHGSQPDAIVVCHEYGLDQIVGLEGYPCPDLVTCMNLNLQLARLTNPNVRCLGFSINTSTLSDEAANTYLREARDQTGMPCVDPVRTGVSDLVDLL